MSKHWYNNGYKQLLTDDPPCGYVLGKLPVTDETRRKMSERRIGKPPANKGISPSKETRDKISDSIKKMWSNGEYSNRKNRKEVSSETRRKLSASLKGRILSEEHKLKIGASNKKVVRRKLTYLEKINRNIKIYNTHKKNGTFNTSKPEEEAFENFYSLFGNNVIRQYLDRERYPFHCDFYIKTLDVFIELNYHWTHGGCQYDSNNENHLKKLSELESKSDGKNFYYEAIYVWTDLDVRKRNIAKENNLKYYPIYDKKQFNDLLVTLTA